MESLKNQLRRYCPETPLVESIYEPILTTPENQTPLENLSGQKVLALSGIGSPLSFERMLSRMGAVEVTATRFPDHHPFTARELDPLFDQAWRGGFIIVTTEKDAVRIPRSYPFYVVSISEKIVSGEEYWQGAIQKPWES